jgi:hypothetical protein
MSLTQEKILILAALAVVFVGLFGALKLAGAALERVIL